jgi:GDP-4-dehydro-6-deoxy-D-mannose reductase
VIEIVETALALGEVEIEFRIDSDRERPTDAPLVLGDNTKLRAATGWEPRISLEESIKDAVEYAKTLV